MSLPMSATNRIQNQTPQLNLNLAFEKARAARAEPNPQTSAATERTYPLGMVLSACPDIVDYAKGGIANWRDFLATAAVVRPMLGISPSAWEEAQMVMGETQSGGGSGVPAAAKFYDLIRRRLFARIDAEGWGGGVLARTRPHGPNQRQEPRAAIRLRELPAYRSWRWRPWFRN